MSLGYDPVGGLLNVRLLEAQNLQPRQFSGTADPYAKVRLLPDKKNFWQTRIHKRTLNPGKCFKIFVLGFYVNIQAPSQFSTSSLFLR